jgi:hypothetical protein
MLLWFEKEFVFRGIVGCGPLFYFKMAICKMGSKFVTLGSKVIFLGGNIFIFLSSKITFLAAKVGSRNYFFGQQEIFF